MGNHHAFLLAIGAVLLPLQASSLELVAPAPEAAFQDGRVVVIGKGAKPPAGQGTLQWQGGSTPVSAWAGRFYVAAELRPGENAAKLLFGETSLDLKWTVGNSRNPYRYHPRVLDQDCKGCHDPENPPEPGGDVSNICYSCHTRYSGRSSVHGPTAGGFCTACHDPHGSSLEALLKVTPAELCSTCHNRPITTEHQKIKEETPCMDCHDPHGSSRAYNLKRR